MKVIAPAGPSLVTIVADGPVRAARCEYWLNARPPVPRWRAAFKRIVDVGLSLLLLLLLSPVFAAAAFAIKLASRGPVFFSQRRVGKGGQEFSIFKFRTMIDGAHLLHDDIAHLNEIDGPALKIANDPRLHGLGPFLRRSSIDELPQLWNVLRGEMSLVGPRPALPKEVESYQPHYFQRFSVPPGITGLWQTSGRANVPFRRWMAMDVWYARHWSPAVDLWLLACTIPAVIRGDGAW